MIESTMMVALGFCAATLVALLVMPFVSRRAAGRAVARLQALLPLNPAEMAAERDGLRANAAVEQRRLEQRLARSAAAAAHTEADLGRRTAELVGVAAALDAERTEKAALSGDLERAQTQLAAAQTRGSDLDRAVAELKSRMAQEELAHRATALKREEFETLAEQRRAIMAALETRISGIEANLIDRNDDLERARQEAARLRGGLNEAARDRDLARNEILLLTTQRAMLQDDIKSQTRRADEIRLRLQARAEAMAAVERQLMDETAARRATETALADLRRRFQLLEARLIEAGGQAAETLVDSELDALRASLSEVSDLAIETLAGPARDNGDVAIEATEALAVR